MKKLLFLLAVMLIAVGMCVAQSPATGSSSSSSGNAASQSSGTADQGTAATPNSAADQNPAGTADQNGAAANDNGAANANGRLPQTGSELPLLAMLGIGTLGTGLVNRFRK